MCIYRLKSWRVTLAPASMPPDQAPITHDHDLEQVRVRARNAEFARNAVRHLFNRAVVAIEEVREEIAS